MARPEPIMPDPAPSRRWLSIVGIGEDGIEGLSAGARGLIARAEIVFGGERHLALAAPLDPWRGEAVAEPVLPRGRRGLGRARAPGLRARLGRSLLLWRRLDARAATWSPEETWVVPAPSAFSLAAARLGWALPETVLALGAWPRARPHPAASSSRRADAGADLRRRRAGGAGAPSHRDRVRAFEAHRARSARRRPRAHPHHDRRTVRSSASIAALNIVAIEVVAAPGARIIAYTPGLADDLFEHDGQITKREIRAVTLSSLAPRRGELLWDIGAGSGSVAIEWMLADPSLRAIAIEARADRAARISRNAAAFGVPESSRDRRAARPRRFRARSARCDLCRRRRERATACSKAAMRRSSPGGRLVANAVTLETESELIARHAALGGDAHAHRRVAGRQRRRQDRLASRHAGHAMDLGEAMIVAGIGCRKGASAARDRRRDRRGADRSGPSRARR